MTPLRVILGVPSGGHPAKPFLEALARLQLGDRVERLDRSVVYGNYIPGQRELIMREAVEGDYDYLLFLDDDIVAPPDALLRLLDVAESDPRTVVVGGLYVSRDAARPIVVANWDSHDTSGAYIPAYTSTSTAAVDGVGFGCALLRVAVARHMDEPYFPAHVYIERRARVVRQCDEDYRYCERVRQLGYVVRLDARVRCGHYDRGSDTIVRADEDDALTERPRMIVAHGAATRLVPYDATLPRIAERHRAADLIYITVD